MMWLFLLLSLIVVVAYYFWPEAKLPKDAKIDKIIVYKKARKMQVFENGKFLKTYKIALGKNPVGHKQVEGDNKTPEGLYFIDNRNADSKFHKNLGISYPNEADLKNAEAIGRPAGGDIKIHGLRNGRGHRGKFHRWRDWTAGCIAVGNFEMEELFESVVENAVIEIKA